MSGKRWTYSGDVNLEYGGTFYRLGEWGEGYVTAVEVTDLDSACGFTGAVEIAEFSIVVDRPERWGEALPVIGARLLDDGAIDDNGTRLERDSREWRLCLVYALKAHGYYDRDRSETLQLDSSEPMESRDGWKADKRLRGNAKLCRYVRREWLR